MQPATLDRIFPDGYPGIETSMVMPVRPELVDLTGASHHRPAALLPYDRYPGPCAQVPPSGVLSLLEDCTAGLLAAVSRKFS